MLINPTEGRLAADVTLIVVAVAVIAADNVVFAVDLGTPVCLLTQTCIGRPLAFLLGRVEYVDSEIRLILISCWLDAVPVRITWSSRSTVSVGIA